jgi:hypothetical protein
MKNIRPTLTPKDLEGYKVFDKLRGKVEKWVGIRSIFLKKIKYLKKKFWKKNKQKFR